MSEATALEQSNTETTEDDFLTEEEIDQDILDKYNFLVSCSSARTGEASIFDRLGVIYRRIFK